VSHSVDLDWPMLARPHQTVVIYMGLGGLEIISEQLIAHGLSPETPAALIANASQRNQRCLRGSLRELPGIARVNGVRSPALLVIGHVAALHERLAPFMQGAPLHCSV